MIWRLTLLLAGALWLCGCGAPDAARDWPAPSPAIWQVTAPEGAHSGWLFGTVHALPDDIPWRSAALDEALGRSGVLVVEIADLDDGSAARSAFDAVSREPGLPPLIDRLPKSGRERLEGVLADAGVGRNAYAGIKTWAAALMLASTLRDYDPANGVDRVLIDQAEHVAGLESFSEQYASFDSLSRQAQVALVRAIVEEPGGARQDARIEAWLTGDLDSLDSLSEEALLTDPELRQTLLVERNHAWARQIAALIAQGRRPFVAVGAGHMLGEEGLPALLDARGFRVARLQ